MLSSVLEHYERQQRLSAMALREARRSSSRGSRAVAQIVGAYQVAAVALSLQWGAEEIAEQGISAPPAATVNTAALLTGEAVVGMLDAASSESGFARIVASLVQDAARTATTVDVGRRPALTGYVRYLSPPSCGRCAVLAGRVYRYSQGFLRHPLCDCQMVPTNTSVGPDLVSDPSIAFELGLIRGLSKADTTALESGADLGQVVNVRRRAAGLSESSSVLERGGRLTPAGVMRLASDRQEVITLLRSAGYLL